MPFIHVTCPSCSTILKTPPEAAGNRVRCSVCKNVMTVPKQTILAGPPPDGFDFDNDVSPPRREAIAASKQQPPLQQPPNEDSSLGERSGWLCFGNSDAVVHSLGVSAITLGVVSLFLSLITCFGMISLSLGVLGVLLGGVGVIASVMRGSRGVGFSIVGGAVNGLVLVVGLAWFITVASIREATRQGIAAAKKGESKRSTEPKSQQAGSERTNAKIAQSPLAEIIDKAEEERHRNEKTTQDLFAQLDVGKDVADVKDIMRKHNELIAEYTISMKNQNQIRLVEIRDEIKDLIVQMKDKEIGLLLTYSGNQSYSTSDSGKINTQFKMRYTLVYPGSSMKFILQPEDERRILNAIYKKAKSGDQFVILGKTLVVLSTANANKVNNVVKSGGDNLSNSWCLIKLKEYDKLKRP